MRCAAFSTAIGNLIGEFSLVVQQLLNSYAQRSPQILINSEVSSQTQEGHLPRFSIHALASHQAIGVVTFARGGVVGMSSTDRQNAKNSAVWENPQ
jgi:hypothetical protein